MSRILIVGAGLTGATVAALAAAAGWEVVVLEKEEVAGGNCRDHVDDHGHVVGDRGLHVFHTGSKKVIDFLASYTPLLAYNHRVWAQPDTHGDCRVPLPFSLATRLALGLNGSWNPGTWTPDSLRRETFVDRARRLFGSQVSVALVEGYSQKQWGDHLRELKPSVLDRIPRSEEDAHLSYFKDIYQALPRDGYTSPIERMLLGATVRYRQNAESVRSYMEWYGKEDPIVWTGLVDEVPLPTQHHRSLPWVNLEWEHQTHVVDRYRDVPVVNDCRQQGNVTRRYNWAALPTGNPQAVMTTVTLERPDPSGVRGVPCYPVPGNEALALYREVNERVREHHPNVYLAGRLGTYRYLDMDQAIANAMKVWDTIVEKHSGG